MLSAEAPINQPLMTDGTAYFQLQEEMKNAFESTVLDLPRHMLIQYPHMVHDAHVAVVVSELTLAATRDTIRILAWLKSNAPQTKVIVVSNRVPSGGALEISKKDFEQSIERSIDIVFPDEAKVAAQAAKLGKPMAEIATGKLAAPFTTLSNMVLSHASDDGAAVETKGKCRRQVAGRQSEVDARQAEGRASGLTIRPRGRGGASPPRPAAKTDGTLSDAVRDDPDRRRWPSRCSSAPRRFSGPSASKAVKRRLELLKERHADGVLAANAQAQIRKLMAQRQSRAEGIASTLIPKPALLRKRLEQTGKQISLAKYGMISVGLGVRRHGAAAAQGRAVPARLLRRRFRRRSACRISSSAR